MKTLPSAITTRVLITLILLAVAFISFQVWRLNSTLNLSTEQHSEQAINQRVAPVARIILSTEQESSALPTMISITPANTPESPPTETPSAVVQLDPAGELLYKNTCFACHDTGVANAPKLGDRAAWAPYIATGINSMVNAVIQGKGAMPPKGGAATASEDEIRAAVRYMLTAEP